MRILFLTEDFSGASLCARLHHEGHEVRAHVGNPVFSQTLDGWIEKVPDLGTGLDRVGKDGLIVCDDNGFGPLQDRLRIAGHSVIGGSADGDRLEDDREHAQRIFAAHGLRSIPTHTFDSTEAAIRFLEAEGGEWVLKFNGHADKTACYVAQLPDSADVLDVLRLRSVDVGASLADARAVEAGSASGTPTKSSIILQKRIRGVEIGVARYFNGKDWVGPIELNIEHKKLSPGDLGPKTAEMGTLLWYTDDENNRLFREVLAPLKPHLREIGFRGDFDINCIVNEDDAWPLEATTRFGYPAVQAQMALHETPWGEFLKSVAGDLRWRSGYAVVVLIAVPPFPFCTKPCDCALNPRGLEIRFRQPPSAEDWRHIHFEGVQIRRAANGSERFFAADSTGYVLHVTGHGPTIEAARAAAYRRAENIVTPRMFYRTDIGERFLNHDLKVLGQRGWM